MRRRMFSASVLPVPPGCDPDAKPDVFSIDTPDSPDFWLTLPAVLRMFREMTADDLADVGNVAMRRKIALLQRRVNEALAVERALGREPDVQRTVNLVCDLEQFGRDVEADKGDALDRMFARLEGGES